MTIDGGMQEVVTVNHGWDFILRPQGITLKSRVDTAEKTLALGWDHKAPGRPIDYTYQGT